MKEQELVEIHSELKKKNAPNRCIGPGEYVNLGIACVVGPMGRLNLAWSFINRHRISWVPPSLTLAPPPPKKIQMNQRMQRAALNLSKKYMGIRTIRTFAARVRPG